MTKIDALSPLATKPVPSLFCLLLFTAGFQICVLYSDYLSDHSLSSK